MRGETDAVLAGLRGRLTMELEDLAPWADAFAAYCARFDDLFVRSESRVQARK
jgi:hypothetical protein